MLTKRKILLAISVLIIVLVLFYIIPLFFKSDKEAYQFVSTWGSEGSQPGQFSGPIGIAIDKAGFIYVSDAEDLGKVIGKGGAHASAIRTLMAATSGKEKKRYILEIIEY